MTQEMLIMAAILVAVILLHFYWYPFALPQM